MKILALLITAMMLFSVCEATTIKADHTAVDSFAIMPGIWTDSVQQNLNVFYMRQSHGGRLLQGMKMLVDAEAGEADTTYIPPDMVMSWWPYTACSGEEMGWNGDTCFAGQIEDTLATLTTIDINVVSLSWCAAVFTMSETETREWISGWKRLCTTHDTIDWIIQTSRLWDPQSQDSATYRALHVNANQYIRDVFDDSLGSTNNAYLYDYADIEWFDRLDSLKIDSTSSDSGNTWPKRYWDTATATAPTANTGTPDYDGRWTFLTGNSNPTTCAHCYGGTWDAYLCDLHGRAFWYLLARVAGWDGTSGDTVITNTTKFFVSKNGDDANTGLSWDDAILTIDRLEQVLGVGDTAIFGAGVYNDEQLSPPSGGTAVTAYYDSAYWVSNGANGNLATISGRQAVTGWVPHDTVGAENIWVAPFAPVDAWSGAAGTDWGQRCYTLTYDDTLMKCWDDALTSVDAEEDYISINGSPDSIYFWVPEGGVDNNDPNDHTIYGSVRPALRIPADDMDSLRFYGLNFTHGKQGVVLFTSGSCNNIIFRACSLKHVGHALGENPAVVMSRTKVFDGPYWVVARDITIVGCDISSARGTGASYYEHAGSGINMYCAEQVTVCSTTVHDVSGNGIMWKNQTATSNDTVLSANVVKYCTLENIQEFGIVGGNNDYYDSAYGNVLINIGEAAFEPNHGSEISFGRWFIGNNTVYRAASFFWSRFDMGGDSTCELKYNVFLENSADWSADYYNDWARLSANTGYWEIDYNIWYDSSESFDGYSGGDRTWSTWQSTSGFDVNGFNTDPGFTNTNTGDFSRSSASDEMNETYGGRTWTVFGAIQPAAAETPITTTINGIFKGMTIQ